MSKWQQSRIDKQQQSKQPTKNQKNSTQNKTTITNIALHVNKTTALRAAPQAFNMWPCKNIGGVFQWIHWILLLHFIEDFPVQGHILSTSGAALTKVKLLADRRPPLTHVPASPYAALAGATREFNELITPATRAKANLRVVTTPTTLPPPPPPVTTPVSSSSTSALEARKLINPTWAPTPRPEETGTTTDLPPVIPALLDDAKPAPVTPLPELWNTRRLLDTIAAMLLLVGFYFFCWFLSSLYVHSRYEGAEKKKKKSKQTTSEKNTHKKKKKKKRKMKMRVRTESERERRGCSLSTQRLQNNTKPQKNTHKNTKKKSREKGLGFRVLCL